VRKILLARSKEDFNKLLEALETYYLAAWEEEKKFFLEKHGTILPVEIESPMEIFHPEGDEEVKITEYFFSEITLEHYEYFDSDEERFEVDFNYFNK
jgi:hypothetical protein